MAIQTLDQPTMQAILAQSQQVGLAKSAIDNFIGGLEIVAGTLTGTPDEIAALVAEYNTLNANLQAASAAMP